MVPANSERGTLGGVRASCERLLPDLELDCLLFGTAINVTLNLKSKINKGRMRKKWEKYKVLSLLPSLPLLSCSSLIPPIPFNNTSLQRILAGLIIFLFYICTLSLSSKNIISRFNRRLRMIFYLFLYYFEA